MGTTSKEIGTRLQKLLQEKDISQRELSEIIGVTDVTVSREVNGFRKQTLQPGSHKLLAQQRITYWDAIPVIQRSATTGL